MSVRHFDFQDFFTPPPQRKCPQKMSTSFRTRAIYVRTFWNEQLMSALFENVSYESQCTGSIWTECSEYCVVMLRFPCLYNIWALNFVMELPRAPGENQNLFCHTHGAHLRMNLPRLDFATKFSQKYGATSLSCFIRGWNSEFSVFDAPYVRLFFVAISSLGRFIRRCAPCLWQKKKIVVLTWKFLAVHYGAVSHHSTRFVSVRTPPAFT